MTTDRDAHDAFKGLRLKNPRWTWKDYDMVAESLNHELREISGIFGPTQPLRTADMRETVKSITERFADTFAEDNPAFKRDLFLKACGVLQ